MGATYQKTIGQPVGKLFRGVEKSIGWNKDVETKTVESSANTDLAAKSEEQAKLLQELSNQQETAAQLASRRKRGRASTLLTAGESTGNTAAKSLLGA